MIKNIVFDLGNVLISFRPAEYFEKNNYPDNVKEKILTDIFGSKEWQLLDSGEISTSDAIHSISLKSSLNKEEIEHIFNLRTDLMFPLDQNVKVLPELKKQGFKLYFLSNFPIDIFEEVRSGYYFFKYFEGGIISAEAKASKPDPGIYDIILKKYSLIPEECLFIDDIEINVRAAEQKGMKGLVTFGRLGIKDEIIAALNSKTEALRP